MNPRSPRLVVAVVDDDRSILRSLAALLESADHPVRVFTSGAALFESGCLPDVACLISDIDMPGIDGFELLRLVQEERPDLPIILITGYPETLKRSPLAGGSAPRIFSKPFDGQELLRAVGDALGGAVE